MLPIGPDNLTHTHTFLCCTAISMPFGVYYVTHTHTQSRTSPEGNRPHRSEVRGRQGRLRQPQPRQHQRQHQHRAPQRRGAHKCQRVRRHVWWVEQTQDHIYGGMVRQAVHCPGRALHTRRWRNVLQRGAVDGRGEQKPSQETTWQNVRDMYLKHACSYLQKPHVHYLIDFDISVRS